LPRRAPNAYSLSTRPITNAISIREIIGMKNDPDGHAASPDEQRAPNVSRLKF
jgi:hypothetical protein